METKITIIIKNKSRKRSQQSFRLIILYLGRTLQINLRLNHQPATLNGNGDACLVITLSTGVALLLGQS